ncbi:MAG: hypothetical protein LBQ38_08420 [Spirochaetaceae bacterium]|jgi:uncharacterized protein (DUF608 family)|nr:hypothetical protein [Spirochaetaceae bacterium]
MPGFTFKGPRRNQISFPLGGIGTGSLGLSGTGRFIDWEIFNRPAKGSLNGFSHFAVKAEADNRVLDARVLHGDLPPPYTGNVLPGSKFHGYGFGPERYLLSGVPHFRDNTFTGTYPFARVDFIDDTFPGQVSLRAFNPFIPLNDKDSGIPAAFFEIEIENTRPGETDYTVCLSVANPYTGGDKRNRFYTEKGISAIKDISAITLSRAGVDPGDPRYGDMTFAVQGEEDVSCQEYWYRGAWFDNIGVFWRDFTGSGALKNRFYPAEAAAGKVNEDVASLAVRLHTKAGEKRRVRFIISWNQPNNYNDWNDHKGTRKPDGSFTTWKNYYATVFKDSADSAAYGLRNWDRLEGESRKFRDALFSSDLPEAALDAVSANISLLKSPTVWRLEDGTFYGWEGVMTDQGSCEGSCTHVWNYAYALPFLFPALERSMREADYRYNLREDGGMPFRIQLPLGSDYSSFRPCVDGQMGGVIKVYREWKILGDTEWLRRLWPTVKKSLEFAWSAKNKDRWDAEKSGVMRGRQHHTLDMELFGANAWLEGFYLAALKAASEMAEALGDPGALSYRELFEKGKQWSDKNLFNGDYYIQQLDLRDRSLIESFEDNDTLLGGSTLDAYWNDEAGEIKYQIAEGCEIDQAIAQWHANLCGLGEIFDTAQVKKALGSIYKYNYKPSLRYHFNPCRIYGLNDEAGAVICEWPPDKYKPVIPLPYAEECMHGYEYQAAIHMIQEGMEKEGLDIVRGIRDRYNGENRNPWNEMECGSNYARSMASYALLLAYSGFSFDMTKGEIGFAPIREGSYFWSLDKAWGIFEQRGNTHILRVLYGEQDLRRLRLPRAGRLTGAVLDGVPVSFTMDGNYVVFKKPVSVKAGQDLTVQ